jgi:hypothetical protein
MPFSVNNYIKNEFIISKPDGTYTMNREFLYDYEKDEIARQEQHYEKVSKGQIEPTGYPDNTRFTKTNNPLVLCDTNIYRYYGEKIWSQIPFAGTLVIPLNPSTKSSFLAEHSFDVKDIGRMIDLAKEAGRVQFVLSSKPTSYEGLDHLQSIFEEMRPPIVTTPWHLLGSNEDYDRWINEFNQIAVASYDDYLKNRVEKIGESKQYLKSTKDYQASVYAKINWLKMEDAVEDVKKYIKAAPGYVLSLLDYCGFLTENIFNPILLNTNYSLETLKSYNSNIKAQPGARFQAPVEIGAYIMNKIIKNPQDYYGCLGVIEKYNENGLYKVLESLDTGLKRRKKDRVLDITEQLGILLDNIWKDASNVKQHQTVTSWSISGASITIGIAGSMFAEDPIIGLLASLGLPALEKLSHIIIRSKKVTKLFNPDYIYNIYDFKEKHSIK